MYEINAIGVKYVEKIIDNIDYFNKYFNTIRNTKGDYIELLEAKGYEIIDTDASWFFLKRYTGIDNLKTFNDLGMSFRTLVLPDGNEYIKFNYDLKLNDG